MRVSLGRSRLGGGSGVGTMGKGWDVSLKREAGAR